MFKRLILICLAISFSIQFHIFSSMKKTDLSACRDAFDVYLEEQNYSFDGAVVIKCHTSKKGNMWRFRMIIEYHKGECALSLKWEKETSYQLDGKNKTDCDDHLLEMPTFDY